MLSLTKVDVYPFRNPPEGTGVAYVSAVFNEDLVLKKMTLRRFQDGSFQLFPPGVKKPKPEASQQDASEGQGRQSEWDDYYFFMKAETRTALFNAAVEAYKAKVAA